MGALLLDWEEKDSKREHQVSLNIMTPRGLGMI